MPVDDRALISSAHLYVLRQTLRWPLYYNQRLSERVTFLPRGGQHWRRDMQLLIPELPSGGAQERAYVVSLGFFRPERLVDFAVHDCRGHALNLVTRRQHGHCLAITLLYRYLTASLRAGLAPGVEAGAGPVDPGLANLYARVYTGLVTAITAQRLDSDALFDSLRDLIVRGGETPELATAAATSLRTDLRELLLRTQYLCWVRATPGQAVRLTATYTLPDRLFHRRPPGEDQNPWPARYWERWRRARALRYALVGLSPFEYSLTIGDDSTASYYFSIEPPEDCNIAYLDWGRGNSLEPGHRDWISAYRSVHLYNGIGGPSSQPEDPQPVPAASPAPAPVAETVALPVPSPPPLSPPPRPTGVIYAAIRTDPAEHKQIVFAALLNLVFIWLAEAGRLQSEIGSAAAPWLALVPGALIAYSARHRRNYFAAHTRLIRGIIWFYICFNFVFVVSIFFDIAPNGSFADRNGFSDDFVSTVMATLSIVVIALFSMMGRRSHDGFVASRFRAARRRLARSDPQAPADPSHLRESGFARYVAATRAYGNLTVLLTLALLALMVLVILSGHGPEAERAHHAGWPHPHPELLHRARAS